MPYQLNYIWVDLALGVGELQDKTNKKRSEWMDRRMEEHTATEGGWGGGAAEGDILSDRIKVRRDQKVLAGNSKKHKQKGN